MKQGHQPTEGTGPEGLTPPDQGSSEPNSFTGPVSGLHTLTLLPSDTAPIAAAYRRKYLAAAELDAMLQQILSEPDAPMSKHEVAKLFLKLKEAL